MNLVLTLVTRSTGALKLANAAPGGLGAATERGGRVWSVTEREIDVKRESDLIAFLNSEATAAQIDWAVTPQANRRKKLLISDMDSTIIGQECLDELADFAGFKAEVSAITERAMRGELDFASACAPASRCSRASIFPPWKNATPSVSRLTPAPAS